MTYNGEIDYQSHRVWLEKSRIFNFCSEKRLLDCLMFRGVISQPFKESWWFLASRPTKDGWSRLSSNIETVKSISGDNYHQTEKFYSLTYPFLESLGISWVGSFYPLNFENYQFFVFKIVHWPIVRQKDGFNSYFDLNKAENLLFKHSKSIVTFRIWMYLFKPHFRICSRTFCISFK